MTGKARVACLKNAQEQQAAAAAAQKAAAQQKAQQQMQQELQSEAARKKQMDADRKASTPQTQQCYYVNGKLACK